MKNLKKLSVFLLLLVIVGLFCIPKIAEDMDKKQIGVKQTPFTGNLDYWTNGGFQWQWFGSVTIYDKTSQIWFNEVFENPENGDISLIPELTNPAMPITYNDKGKGFVLGSLRIELPTEPKYLERIQIHYGSMDRLVNDLIRPTVGKVIIACGPLMSSLESVSEKRTDLYQYITDQLNSGIYKTRIKEIETINALTGEAQITKIAETVPDSTSSNGLKRQEESPFTFYGLRVTQVAVADLKYEKATLDQISKQREADMSIVTAKAKAAEAVQRTIQITEEGKAAAESAKWEQEKIKAVEVTKAQQAYEVATLNAKEADEKAKKIIAEGKAEAEANRLKVQAGLTPQEAAEWQYKTTVGVAEALSKSNVRWVPEIMMNGQGSNSNSAMDAVGLNMLMDVAKKMKQ